MGEPGEALLEQLTISRKISCDRYQARMDTLLCHFIGGAIVGLGQTIPRVSQGVVVTSLSGGHVWREATAQEPLRASAEGARSEEKSNSWTP